MSRSKKTGLHGGVVTFSKELTEDTGISGLVNQSPGKPLNLPLCGIFQADEVKATAIPWRPEAPSPHPGAHDPDNLTGWNCFLCGVSLSRTPQASNQDTSEDVYPQWLQRYFGLPDLPVEHGNADARKYSELLIPCCVQCNGSYLSRFEDRVATAFRGGYSRLNQLRKADLFLWCAKLYYGIVHLDVSPRDPRTKAAVASTAPADELHDLGLLLRLMQGFRKRVVIFGPKQPPFSLLLFPLHSGRDPGFYFNVRHVTLFPAIAMQLASVGILSVFDDFAGVDRWYRAQYASALRGKTLHPDQFWELAGRAFYHSFLNPYAVSMSTVEGRHDVKLDLFPRREKGRRYDPREEAFWIEQTAKAPKNFFWDAETGGQRTILRRSDGLFHEIPFTDISEMPARESADLS